MDTALLAHILIPVVLAILPFARSRWFYDYAEDTHRTMVGKRLFGTWAGIWFLLPVVLGVVGLSGWVLLLVTIPLAGMVGGIIGDVLP